MMMAFLTLATTAATAIISTTTGVMMTSSTTSEANKIIMGSFGTSLTLVLLVVALGIFSWLTAKSSSKIKSFQFQIMLLIVIWVIGEMFDLLQEESIIQLPYARSFGIYIHALVMALFSVMIWIRFYHSRRHNRKMVDKI